MSDDGLTQVNIGRDQNNFFRSLLGSTLRLLMAVSFLLLPYIVAMAGHHGIIASYVIKHEQLEPFFGKGAAYDLTLKNRRLEKELEQARNTADMIENALADLTSKSNYVKELCNQSKRHSLKTNNYLNQVELTMQDVRKTTKAACANVEAALDPRNINTNN